MLQPRRGAKIGPIIFGVDLKRTAGRWRVDSFIPQVTFAPHGARSGVYAPADATAPARGGGAALAESRISTQWLFVPLGAFGALLVLPFAVWLAARRRERRAVEAYRVHRTEGRGRV